MNPIKQATMVVGSACLALAVIAHQIPSAQALPTECFAAATSLKAAVESLDLRSQEVIANSKAFEYSPDPVYQKAMRESYDEMEKQQAIIRASVKTIKLNNCMSTLEEYEAIVNIEKNLGQ